MLTEKNAPTVLLYVTVSLFLVLLVLAVDVFLGYNQYWPGGFIVLCFLCPGAPVVLTLMRLRRRGHGLKSHPTDWEKLGIERATPGLQDICLSPTPRRLH